MSSPAPSDQLAIGYDPWQNWDAMNRAGQRLALCNVFYGKECATPDLRQSLYESLRPAMTEAALCGGFSRFDDKGRHVVAWIWRQTTAEPIELLSISKSELEGIVATIRNSATTRFTVYELRSTERRGNHQKVRAYKLSEGEFTVEECKE